MALTVTLQGLGAFSATIGQSEYTFTVEIAPSQFSLNAEIATPGPRGEQGIQGDQGIQGVKGDKGDQGIQGIKGDKGDQGIQGIKGDQGIQGIQGIQGEKGDKGDTGDSGVAYATAPITYDAGTKTVGIDPYYLPLTGGTMSGIAVFSTDGTSDSEVGAWGLGTQKSNDHTQFAEVTYGDIFVHNSAGATHLLPTGVQFPDGTTQTTAATGGGDFLPLAGGTMTGNIIFGTAGQYIGKGTFDTSRGGGYGLSLVCSVGYEFNWQAGWLITTEQNSTTPRPLYLDSVAGTTLRAWDAANNVGTEVSHTAITFPDATTQTTAFTGPQDLSAYLLSSTAATTYFTIPTGTTLQYIDGTGALETFPAVGDRYLTSSTSTLTCDSADGKTMTVGTGLSYTAQQDITVLYNNANHMHGTVTSYNASTGVLTFDANTHSGGPGPFSNWEVNVGGVAGAILPVGGTAGQVLSKINSTNFNTEWTTLSYAPIASPTFTGTVTIPAGASISGYQTTLASATTSTAGKIQLATQAEAIVGTDTAKAMTPQTANAVSYLEAYDQQDITALSFNATVSVQSVLQAANYKNLNHGASTAIGSSFLACLNFCTVGQTTQSVGIDWTKKVILSFNLSRSVASPSAGSVFRACLGKTQAGGAVGDLINTGIGIKIEGSGVVQLMAYRSGALVTTNTTYTPNGMECFAVKLVSYGNGTVECFINGTSVGTNTNAPTAIAAAFLYNTTFECQQTAIVATTAQWTISGIKQSFGKR